MKINAIVNVNNWLIKAVVIKDLLGILVIANMDVINHEILEIMKIVKKRLVGKLVEECTENTDQINKAGLNLAEQ